MEEASSSDASRSQKQRGARSSKSTHTHTRARITTPHSRASPRPSFPPRPSLCLSLYCLHLPLLFHSPSPCQSHAPAAHRHPCAVRAISAASGHSNKHQQRSTAAEACVCQRQRFLRLRSACLVSAQRACARLSEPALPACLCVSTICLPARCLLSYLLACLHSCCCSSCCLSTSITTAGPSGLVVDTLHRSLSRLLACLLACSSLHCLSACVTALPCLALLDRTCRARESTLTTAFRPALPHPVSQSVSQLHQDLHSCSLDRPTDQAATSAPPRQSHQLAQALISISYLSPPRRL